MTEVAIQSFEHVGRELNVTLGEARTALETYVEQPENVSLLNRTAAELHQVQGVLKVLEIYGAALLAEEMEQVARYLVASAGEQKNQAESLDALMRAMVQLPSYLERVLAGGRDLALILLPLLNDLRAVRGSSLLSEGTLLLLNLKSDRQAQPVATGVGEAPLTLEQWARRLRPRFQLGLVGWIRGERTDQNLAMLAEVAHKLEQVATRQPVFQLWWVTGAVIEALQEHGLSGGVSIKRLLGLADREIKRLYELTESRYAQSPAVDLLNNLLYYVGRSESAGPRVTAVRASFRLNELLPVDDAVDQERESLSAPSVKLMQTVAAAIREDLGKVKDVLDIFVRRGSGQPQSLAPQVEMLHKIGDTLGVLGLGELRAAVQGETERLGKIVVGHLAAGAFAAGGYRRDADRRGRPTGWPAGGHDPAAGPHAGVGGVRRCGLPAGAVRGAARMHPESGAAEGIHRPKCRRNARHGRPGCLAGTDARAEGGPADAGQVARRGAGGEHSRASEPADAAGRGCGAHRRAAGSPGRCHRQPRVLHGDAAGRTQ